MAAALDTVLLVDDEPKIRAPLLTDAGVGYRLDSEPAGA